MAELPLFSLTNNNNNILTNDKSCVTVEQSISTTVGVDSKKADWNANEFSNTPPVDGFLESYFAKSNCSIPQ